MKKEERIEKEREKKMIKAFGFLNVKSCDFCGKKDYRENEFCSYCGTPLEKEREN